MDTERNLCWKLNWYRHSELEGALLLGRLVRLATEPTLVCHLTRHCADEARHAWMWQQALTTMGLKTIRITRSYQSFYMDASGPPHNLAEVLALTHIFEQRVDRQFTAERDQPGVQAAVKRVLSVLLKDEAAHLDWIARWMAAHLDGERLLERYRSIDERVYRELLPYRDRIWDIPGLGEEMMTCAPA
jgi:hypothetical protein